MVAAFVVPASLGDRPENQFEFTIGKDTFSIPKVQYIPLGVMEEADTKGVGFQHVLEALGLTAAVKALKTQDMIQIAETVKAWRAASGGVDLGESPASSD